MCHGKSLGNVAGTRAPCRGQASLNELAVLLFCVACGCAKPMELMKLDDGDLTVKSDASTDTGGTTDATVVQMTGGSSTGGASDTGGTSDTGGIVDIIDASTSDASDADSATGTNSCGANRCFDYTPSNVDVTTLDLSSPGNATLDCGTTEITSSGGNVTFTNWCGTMPTPVVVSQSMGPDLAVIPVANLTIAAGNTLRLTGEMPVVLVAAGDMDISGTIDASSSSGMSMSSGAGANWMCGTSTGGDGSPDSGSSSGGGGGGFGTAGGAGGDGNNVSGGTPGSSRTQSDPLSPLVGGCAGGIGAYDSSCNPNGGAGGGVVQLAASGTLTVSGEINVAGANGNQGCGSDGGGGGGGSGGGVLIEGEDVDLTGATITADGGNGGRAGNNGGAGSTDSASPGVNGRNDGALGGSGGGGGYGRIQATAQGTCTGCP